MKIQPNLIKSAVFLLVLTLGNLAFAACTEKLFVNKAGDSGVATGNVQVGTPFKVDIIYTNCKEGQADPVISELAAQLHWDSSLLTLTPESGTNIATPNGEPNDNGSPSYTKPALANFTAVDDTTTNNIEDDGDSNTDKALSLSWVIGTTGDSKIGLFDTDNLVNAGDEEDVLLATVEFTWTAAATPATLTNMLVTNILTNTDSTSDRLDITSLALQFNSPPTANAGINQSVNVGDIVTLSGSGSDPEGEAITYAWEIITPNPDNTGITLDSSTPGSPTFTVPNTILDTTDVVFKLTVSADGSSADSTVTVTVNVVNTAPTFARTIADLNILTGKTITTINLPTAIGGNGNTDYTLTSTPALPTGTGLILDLPNYTINGSPTLADVGTTTFTWTAADSDSDTSTSDTATLTFTITVTQDLVPTFTTTIQDKNVIRGLAITQITLPIATGGNGNLDHNLIINPSSSGLSYSAINGFTISGSTTVTTPITVTWFATDEDDSKAEQIFTITAAANTRPQFQNGTNINDVRALTGQIDTITLPAATGGNGAISYTLAPALPAGLTFNTPALTITGSTSVTGTNTFTLTANDADSDITSGDYAALSFDISIIQNTAPGFQTTTALSRTGVTGKAISPITLPASGGNTPITYNLDPPTLPAGLTFSATSLTAGTIIRGIPTAAGNTPFTWTATDGDGETGSIAFTINIAADSTPTFAESTITQKVILGDAITEINLPTATDGNAPVSHALSVLPAGLTRSGNTISGTPGVIGPINLAWTATDNDGSIATLNYIIKVEHNQAPIANAGPNKTYSSGNSATITLDGSGSRDPDEGDTIAAYAWSAPAGITLSGANTVNPSFSAPIVTTKTDYEFGLVVTDNRGLNSATDTVTISITPSGNVDILHEQILTKLNQAVVASTMDSVIDRSDAAFSGGQKLATWTLDGQTFTQGDTSGFNALWGKMKQYYDKIKNGKMNLKEMLSNTSFSMPINSFAGGSNSGKSTVWGRGNYKHLSGNKEVEWDGDLTSVQIGIDSKTKPDTLLGGMLSWADGKTDYTTIKGGKKDDKYNHSLISIHPYAVWKNQQITLWSVFGFGKGELEIVQDQQKSTTDTQLLSASAGVKGKLLPEIYLKGDVSLVKSKIKANGSNIEQDNVSSERFRLLVETKKTYQIASGSITPSAEAGVRYDTGDGATGVGGEFGAGFTYKNSENGVIITSKARTLLGQDGYKEWGIDGSIRYQQNSDGRGFSFNFEPSYGDTQSDKNSVFNNINNKNIGENDSLQNYASQIKTSLSYGISNFNKNAILKPSITLLTTPKNRHQTLALNYTTRKNFNLTLTTTATLNKPKNQKSNNLTLKSTFRF